MTSKSLEQIKPIVRGGRLNRTSEHIEFSSAQSETTTLFELEAENYLRLLLQGLSLQEIILQYHINSLRMNFVSLKESLSKLYWNNHLENARDFSDHIESSEGLPAYDGILSDPLVELPIDKTLSPIFVVAPLVLVLLVLKLFKMDEVTPFVVFLFPQIFLTAKAALSALVSRFLFQNSEPMSLHASLFGIYYKLSSGKRTAISTPQFLVHFLINAMLATLSLIYFYHSTNIIFMHFGPPIVLLMFILCLSPVHNTDLSNFRYQLQKLRARREHLKLPEKIGEKVAKFIFFISTLIFNLMAIFFCMYALMQTIQFVQGHNNAFLIYQFILDLAAVCVFLDWVDQLEQLSGALSWSPQGSRFHFKNHKQNISKLIREIPIFETLPEEVLAQMAKAAKIIPFKPGARVFKNGDLSTDLYVVIEGHIGIYRKLKDGKRQKVIDLHNRQIFGEGGFLLTRPRMGSAYALKKTTLMALKRPKSFTSSNHTQEAMMSKFQKKIWSLQALVQSELFGTLPPEAIMELVNRGEILEIEKQKAVIQQGAPSDALWIIIQGACQAMIDHRPVREMHAKDVFGEIGILWNSPRTSSVVTTEPSILLKVRAEDVWNFLSHSLNIGIALQELGEHRLGS